MSGHTYTHTHIHTYTHTYIHTPTTTTVTLAAHAHRGLINLTVRKVNYPWTDRQTDRQDNYSNPATHAHLGLIINILFCRLTWELDRKYTPGYCIYDVA